MPNEQVAHLPEASGYSASPNLPETHSFPATSESPPSSSTNPVSLCPFLEVNEYFDFAARSFQIFPNYDEQSLFGANSSLRSLWDSGPLESPFAPSASPHLVNSGYWQCSVPENLSQNPGNLMIPTSTATVPASASFSAPPGFLPNCGYPGKSLVALPGPSRPVRSLGLGVGCDYSTGGSGMYSSLGVIHYPADRQRNSSHPGGLWQDIPTGPSKQKSRRITRHPRSNQTFYCGFCMKNNERPEVYRSHNLRIFNAERNAYQLQCPILREYCCPICNATGDDAHTVTYCPKIIDNEGHRPVSIVSKLKQSGHNSAGYKRSDSRKPFNNRR